MTSYFCSPDYNKLFSVSYVPLGIRKFLKQHAHLPSCAHELAECYLLQAICVWHISDVYTLHSGHPVTQYLMVG